LILALYSIYDINNFSCVIIFSFKNSTLSGGTSLEGSSQACPLVFSAHGLFCDAEAIEEGDWEELDNHSPNKFTTTEGDAKVV